MECIARRETTSRFSMKPTRPALLSVLLSCFLLACNQTNTLAAPMDRKPGTPKERQLTVAPHLDCRIPKGRSVLWCATLQFMWNELVSLAGGSISMHKAPPLVGHLNRCSTRKQDVDPASVVAMAGIVGEGIIVKLRKELCKKFGNNAGAQLVDRLRGLPMDSVVAYAFLRKTMVFPHQFQRLDPMEFQRSAVVDDGNATAPRVAVFGIKSYSPGNRSHRKWSDQIKIVRYGFRKEGKRRIKEFIVELGTKHKMDRVILAAVEPRATLGRTVEVVLAEMKSENSLTIKKWDVDAVRKIDSLPASEVYKYACLLPEEELIVPVLNCEAVREFPELYGEPIVAKNPKVNGLPFTLVVQRTAFRLDERGAKVESEATGVLFGDAPTREFRFTRPFLVMLIRRGALRPYFVLWVGGPEVLVPATPGDGAG